MWLVACNFGRCSSKWIITYNYIPSKYMHIFSFYLSSFPLSSLLPRLQIHILFFGAMTGTIPNLQIYLEKIMISTLSFCSATKTTLYLSIPLYHHSFLTTNYIHFLLSWLLCVCVTHSVVSDSLWLRGPQTTSLLCLWNSPGKDTGVGCHFLLQWIFVLTRGSNRHCR